MLSHDYVAGFFDGEGSVSITNVGRVQVAIAQKKPEILKMIQDIYGGKIYDKGNPYFSGYNWKVTDRKGIISFLTAIYPYSVVKKKDIELGLKAAKLIREHNNGCNPLSLEEIQERMAIRIEMQEIRPAKMFKNITSDKYRERESIKERYNYECSKCGQNLKNKSLIYQIIRDDKLICRKCNALMNIKEIKPLTREQIENALKESNGLDEACKKLGVNRSSLYKKRKALGMPDRIYNRGNYKTVTPYSDEGYGVNNG